MLLMVFLVSGIIRLAAAAIFLTKFKEVRPVEAIGHGELVFRVSNIKSFAEATFSLITGLFNEQKEDGDRHTPDYKRLREGINNVLQTIWYLPQGRSTQPCDVHERGY